MAKAKNQTNYVDGFVLVVPKNKVAAYRKMANEGREVWMRHGAIDYKECMGDDLTPKSMGDEKPFSFLEMTKAKSDETVWFSFIVYKSRKHRDVLTQK